MHGNQLISTTQSVELKERVLVDLKGQVTRTSQVSVEQLVDSTLKDGFCHHLASTETVVKTPAL